MSALPAETMTTNGTDFVSWRHCDVHARSTFNILSLCLSTLVICVWNAFHPDVPDPGMSRLRVYRMRFIGFLIGLFLPELLVLNALYQCLEARDLFQSMDETYNPLLPDSYWTPLLESLKEMYPRALTMSYWKEAWRPQISTESTQSRWTMTQSFYAIMNAFHAISKSGHVTTLRPRDIKALCKADSSKRIFFTQNAIEDRSKAGALAKALFCWQLLVFAISCIARRTEDLPLSLLEITTLAHSLCGLAAFALWWHKPHSVNEVIVVPIEESFTRKLGRNAPPATEKSMIRGLDIVVNREGDDLAKAVLSSLAVAALYGLPHLLGLSTEFPTLAERRCWQVATAIIISTPVFLAPLAWLINKLPYDAPVDSEMTTKLLFYGVFFVYCIASCFIVAESFRQLFALPSGAFVAPALVCYLPHFS